ncbi:hypothetical protein GCK32_019910 [Trichostrongylus colubriformis]|uniref:Uncharacterized protein n=1 Tax=Trichostrongylus colubriformis TaxID=6319 RepID=A0AAN8IE28_TRICO
MGSSSSKPYVTSFEPRRRRYDVGSNYSKEYSQYWTPSSSNRDSNFVMERNAFSFMTNEDLSPLKDNRRYSQFVSSFSKF